MIPNDNLRAALKANVNSYCARYAWAHGSQERILEQVQDLLDRGVPQTSENLVALAAIRTCLSATSRISLNRRPADEQTWAAIYRRGLDRAVSFSARWLVSRQDPGFFRRRGARRYQTHLLLAMLERYCPEVLELPALPA